MNDEKINKSSKRARILIAPLDWGLGHATRCIPIIQTLLKHGADVVLAAEGTQKRLLQEAFPGLQILHLPGYNIRYARRKNFFIPKLIIQLPKVFFSIYNEKKWLHAVVKDMGIDAVISDNRPGLYHADVPCVYITHQMQIQTGSSWMNTWLRKLHYSFINKFQHCWIPDNEEEHTLAGQLSHPVSYPETPCQYIGLLSRFNKRQLPATYDFLLLISGPEPQRSILEEKLLQAFNNSIYSFTLVRGLPVQGKKMLIQSSAREVYDHLDAAALNELILRSETVVARAGYSTVMDLATLGKKAVLIATPGQTEQEYLANYLNEKYIFPAISQQNISLDNIVNASRQSGYNIPDYDATRHEDAIISWLASVPQSGSAK